MSGLTAIAAVLLDALLGEPRRAHPLCAFGRYARALEHWLLPPPAEPAWLARGRGLLAWALAVLPPTLLCAGLWQFLQAWPPLAAGLELLLLYLAIGQRSLAEHARAVTAALQLPDLALARQRVGLIVSRDTAQLDERAVSAATIESVLENGSDALLAALFWYALAGAPGVLLYRLANTLDAMWGYRRAPYRHFGWAAARLDDGMNYLPARLGALSYALVTGSRSALRCWRMQARHWDSPNGGVVMAAGAGALQLQLGGAATYAGQCKPRIGLGCGTAPRPADIERALRLLQQACRLWLTVLLLGSLLGDAELAHA